jgi:hypothetical protein
LSGILMGIELGLNTHEPLIEWNPYGYRVGTQHT